MVLPSRRDALRGGIAALLSATGIARAAAIGGGAAMLSVDRTSTGAPVAPAFVGLSFETALLAEGVLTAANRSLVSLIRGLAPEGVIRLGGNTSDRPDRRPPRAAIGALGGLLRATGWSLIYGLNLGTGTPEAAAAEAADVTELAGPALIAFQIGNEPDLYDRGLRPRSWNVAGYLADWDRFADAIVARIPEARFAGPDLGSQPGWLAPFAAARGGRVRELTRHYYSDGPSWSPTVTIASMLGTDSDLAAMLEEARLAAASARLPLRMTEANSIYCGGKPGVSDTAAAAVWGADLMLQLAAAGWLGINFHGGSAGMAYSPIVFDADHRATACPLYQGMAFFAAAGARRMLPVRLSPLDGLRGYAMRTGDGGMRVALTNKDLTRTARVAIATDVDRPALRRLAGAAPGAGLAAGDPQAATRVSRDWRRPLDTAAPRDAAFTVAVPPCSAVLIDLDGRAPGLPDRHESATVADR